MFNFIKKIFGENKQKSSNRKNISYQGDFVNINSLDFFGQFTKSPNSHYMIAFSDHFNEYVLLKNEKIICKRTVPRPNDCKIANNGTFIINGWDSSNNLSGTFYAFNNKGNLILKNNLKANLFNNGLSRDGRYATCQTCSSKNEDNNKLFFFDLQKQKLLWSTNPHGGRPRSYKFDVSKQILTLNHTSKNRTSYRYSFNGKFLDEEKLEKEKLANMSAYDIFRNLKKEHKNNLDSLSKKELKENIKKFHSLLNSELKQSKNKYSKLHRYIAETQLKLNNKQKALDFFEKALKINDKVGVKRITKKLKKELKS